MYWYCLSTEYDRMSEFEFYSLQNYSTIDTHDDRLGFKGPSPEEFRLQKEGPTQTGHTKHTNQGNNVQLLDHYFAGSVKLVLSDDASISSYFSQGSHCSLRRSNETDRCRKILRHPTMSHLVCGKILTMTRTCSTIQITTNR